MKKLISGMVCAALCVPFLVSCGGGGEKQSLKVYNAGEYIDTSLIPKFEKENNCTVVYETFDSNESMYTKIRSGEKYDIIIPSDYMIERLIKENSLQKIDVSKLKNYGGIIKSLLGQSFDPSNEYTVPYFWGSVGILYNKNEISKADLEKEGWNILKDTKYKGKLYMYDSERDSFMIALKALGYSLNTDKTEELDAAYNWLVEQNETMAPIYVGDEVIDSMISGNKDMAIVYSGDAAYIMSENHDLDYYEPFQGTNIWTDAMVMTKECTNTDLAYKFMDFMTDPENARANSEAVGYSSAVQSAFDEIRDTVYKDIDAYVPRQDGKKDEYFRYQEPEVKKYCAELWTKVKSHGA